jgi:hypothetical protein
VHLGQEAPAAAAANDNLAPWCICWERGAGRWCLWPSCLQQHALSSSRIGALRGHASWLAGGRTGPGLAAWLALQVDGSAHMHTQIVAAGTKLLRGKIVVCGLCDACLPASGRVDRTPFSKYITSVKHQWQTANQETARAHPSPLRRRAQSVATAGVGRIEHCQLPRAAPRPIPSHDLRFDRPRSGTDNRHPKQLSCRRPIKLPPAPIPATASLAPCRC